MNKTNVFMHGIYSPTIRQLKLRHNEQLPKRSWFSLWTLQAGYGGALLALSLPGLGA